MSKFVLTLACPDRMGIVAAVSSFLLEHRCNITDSAQFGDPSLRRFFMRVSFDAEGGESHEQLRSSFTAIAARFEMRWHLYDMAVRSRVLIMVSRFGHCLNDLLYRYRTGALPIEVRAIVSNHRDFQQAAAANEIAFYYLPVNADTKLHQEAQLLELIESERVDLVVLARYMQILSPKLCVALKERAINIHHSFLPSFQGARPYQQAHDRGVKLIGATAHYVTEELDEGPIIEQDVIRIDHSMSVQECVAAGRDVECAVLSRAVGWHVEHRVLLNGASTVVFK